MGLFILAIIFLVVAVVAIVVVKVARRRMAALDAGSYTYDNWRYTKLGFTIAVAVFVVAFLVTMFFSSFTTVSTKNVAIVTTFGHPDGELSNGAHFIAPWSKTTEMPANVQTDQYLGNSDNDTSNSQQPCMDVRIANQSITCVEVTIRWRIVPGSAPELFRDYKTFEHVRDSLVTLNLKSSLNTAFADYNPLAILQEGKVPQDVLTQVGGQVLNELAGEIGKQIEILQIIIPLVHFDQTTQVNINAFQAAVANTRIATQNVQTAKQQAQANEILSASLEKAGQGVLISKCLDLVAQGKNVPGWCFPPGSSTVLTSPAK